MPCCQPRIDCKVRQEGDADALLDHRDQCRQTGGGKGRVLFQRDARDTRQCVLLQTVAAFKKQQTTPREIGPFDPGKVGQWVRTGCRKAVVVLEQQHGVHLRRQIMRQRDKDEVQTPVRQPRQQGVCQFFAQVDMHFGPLLPQSRQRTGQQERTDRRDHTKPELRHASGCLGLCGGFKIAHLRQYLFGALCESVSY